jgi:hypothetical protein
MLSAEEFDARKLAQSLQLGFAHEPIAVYRSICEALDHRVKTAQDRDVSH